MPSPLTYLLIDGHSVIHAWPELLREHRAASRRHLARIELPLNHLPMVITSGQVRPIAAHLKSLGFRYVTLDLEGFRSGSLNAALPSGDLVPLSLPR